MTKTDFQADKRVVLDACSAIDAAGPGEVEAALAAWTAPDYRWRGMHPLNELTGAEAVAREFWAPLKRALGPLQRRADVFLAGRNDHDGAVWVLEMGHLMGLWQDPWLGVPASGRIAFLRYVEFHRVADGRIAETVSFFDIVAMIQQAGLRPFPPQTGAAILSPGPRSHDGLLLSAQDPREGEKTLGLINAMIDDLVAGGVSTSSDHLARFWHRDMCWFGPAGIGASAFYDGYRRGHTQPFEAGIELVSYHGHPCEIAEGAFGGFFGWPSITVKPTGGFLGMPATGATADMRIVDVYRRDGDKLAENWIFIDLLHFFAMQGVEILDRLQRHPRT